MTFEHLAYIVAALVVFQSFKDAYGGFCEWRDIRRVKRKLEETLPCNCNICQTGRFDDRCEKGERNGVAH